MTSQQKHDYSSYQKGCLCDVCRAANAEYSRSLCSRKRARQTTCPHRSWRFEGSTKVCRRCLKREVPVKAEYEQE